ALPIGGQHRERGGYHDERRDDYNRHNSSWPTPANVTMSFVDSRQALRPAIVIGALGVVFGDIGTSPIYTIQTVFNPGDPHPVPISTDNVYGVVSTIFWSVTIIVTLTYITLVMRADNN